MIFYPCTPRQSQLRRCHCRHHHLLRHCLLCLGASLTGTSLTVDAAAADDDDDDGGRGGGSGGGGAGAAAG